MPREYGGNKLRRSYGKSGVGGRIAPKRKSSSDSNAPESVDSVGPKVATAPHSDRVETTPQGHSSSIEQATVQPDPEALKDPDSIDDLAIEANELSSELPAGLPAIDFARRLLKTRLSPNEDVVWAARTTRGAKTFNTSAAWCMVGGTLLSLFVGFTSFSHAVNAAPDLFTTFSSSLAGLMRLLFSGGLTLLGVYVFFIPIRMYFAMKSAIYVVTNERAIEAVHVDRELVVHSWYRDEIISPKYTHGAYPSGSIVWENHYISDPVDARESDIGGFLDIPTKAEGLAGVAALQAMREVPTSERTRHACRKGTWQQKMESRVAKKLREGEVVRWSGTPDPHYYAVTNAFGGALIISVFLLGTMCSVLFTRAGYETLPLNRWEDVFSELVIPSVISIIPLIFIGVSLQRRVSSSHVLYLVTNQRAIEATIDHGEVHIDTWEPKNMLVPRVLFHSSNSGSVYFYCDELSMSATNSRIGFYGVRDPLGAARALYLLHDEVLGAETPWISWLPPTTYRSHG